MGNNWLDIMLNKISWLERATGLFPWWRQAAADAGVTSNPPPSKVVPMPTQSRGVQPYCSDLQPSPQYSCPQHMAWGERRKKLGVVFFFSSFSLPRTKKNENEKTHLSLSLSNHRLNPPPSTHKGDCSKSHVLPSGKCFYSCTFGACGMCSNAAPPASSGFPSCDAVAAVGACSSISSACDLSCGRCCSDVAPAGTPSSKTCADLANEGKLDCAAVPGNCHSSCGRCKPKGSSAPAVSPVPVPTTKPPPPPPATTTPAAMTKPVAPPATTTVRLLV